jgi:hypothetical protein
MDALTSACIRRIRVAGATVYSSCPCMARDTKVSDWRCFKGRTCIVEVANFHLILATGQHLLIWPLLHVSKMSPFLETKQPNFL